MKHTRYKGIVLLAILQRCRKNKGPISVDAGAISVDADLILIISLKKCHLQYDRKLTGGQHLRNNYDHDFVLVYGF